ncbi:MAG: right-handed parallel beta-helix repeat-containing protein [Alistipes sp.]|nr:right-handed parallel beta-helix repeat-containing protein [Alistipes sp.]
MKRFFRFLMAAAVMFGAVACSQYDEQEVVEGQEVTTTFSIGLEDLGTRLAGDSGMIDKVAWGIYDHQADGKGRFLAAHSSAGQGNAPADFDGEKAEIKVTLFTGKKYDLVFFGYCSANNAYTINWDTRELNVNYSDLANLEARDAFFHIENEFVAGKNKTFTLTRPFAQLNVGQSMEDYDAMQLTQNYIEKSSVTAKAYTTMSLIDASVSNLVDVELTVNNVLNEDLEVNSVGYKHIAMNYLLVNAKEVVNEVAFKFVENAPTYTEFERTYYNVPLQRNYRTNILGRIISDEFDFEIVIDSNFNEPDNDIFHAFQHGGVVDLPSDMEVGHPLVVRSGVKATLNLNGHTLKNNVNNKFTDLIIVEQGATLTINGDGTLEAVSGNDGYAVISEGTVIINGGTIKSGIDAAGEPNAVVYARGNGKVFVNGGTFPNDNASKFVLNKKDADRATTTIEVKGGKFQMFNPADNAAEGAGTNFVAAGYIVENVNNWYAVGIKKSASDPTTLADALNTAVLVSVENPINNGTNVTEIRDNDVVLDMQNNEIIAGGQGTNNYAFNLYGSNVVVENANLNGAGFAVLDNSEVTVNSGAIAAHPGKSGRNMFYVVGNSTVTVNEGNYTFDRTSCYFVYVEAGSTCYINGGNYFKPLANNASKDSFVNNASQGTVVITGGTFNVDPTKWLAEGYEAQKIGKTWYVVKEGTTVAGATDATALTTALNDAKDGGIVVLSKNVDYGTVNAGELKNVTINGAEGAVMIFKTDANSKLENVTLNGVNFEYTGATADCGIVLDANAQIDNLVIDGCTVVGTGAKAGRGLSGYNNNATIVIKNTTFKDLGYPIYAWGGYEALTIENCTFDNIKSWAVMPQSGFDGDLTVSGCNFVNCLGGGLVKAGTLTAGHTFTFTDNTITGCTIAGDHNWFQFNVSAGTAVISGNIKDGAAWTPGVADGLK